MTALRLLRLAVHLALGLLICALVFPRASPARRDAHIRRWSATLLRIFRVRLEPVNEHEVARSPGMADAMAPGIMLERGLVVANHISWLDIFVINAMQPCRFVAKSDIRDWPVLGYLCARSRTIFISRGSMRDVRKTFRNLVESIRDGERVAFFPEGTTAAQGTLLPFHANLFEAAIDASVPIQPLALRYLDAQGSLHAGVDYVGDTTFAQSMMQVLRGPAIRAQLLVLPAIDSDAQDRRSLALATHAAIRAALAQPEAVGA